VRGPMTTSGLGAGETLAQVSLGTNFRRHRYPGQRRQYGRLRDRQYRRLLLGQQRLRPGQRRHDDAAKRPVQVLLLSPGAPAGVTATAGNTTGGSYTAVITRSVS